MLATVPVYPPRGSDAFAGSRCSASLDGPEDASRQPDFAAHYAHAYAGTSQPAPMLTSQRTERPLNL